MYRILIKIEVFVLIAMVGLHIVIGNSFIQVPTTNCIVINITVTAFQNCSILQQY